MNHGKPLGRLAAVLASALAVTLSGAGTSSAAHLPAGVTAGAATGAVSAPAATAPAANAPDARPVSGRAVLTKAVPERGADPSASGGTEAGRAAAAQRALAAYWTPARMKAARPATQLPSLSAAIGTAKRTGALTQATRPTAGAPGEAAPAAAASATSARDGAASRSVSSPAVEQASRRPNLPIGSPAARTSGKIFFTSGNANYVCSGTIVNTEGKSTVWTAGHCLADNGQWHSDWIFVPNYADGAEPYGQWALLRPWTTGEWFNKRDFNYDVGAAIVQRNGGRRIADYLGGQGFSWNQPQQSVCAFGYPAVTPFNGEHLYQECGQTYAISGAQRMVNDMTGGASGGAWLAEFDGAWGFINGNNAWNYGPSEGLMYSPYYGDVVGGLFDTVRRISA